MTSRRSSLVGRSAVVLTGTVLSLALRSTVHAHSAPGVAAIVDEDAHEVRVLRLYAGHAQHERDGWHFYCSSLYQGQGSEISAALPGGGVAIAARSGIWVLQRDGTIAPHPAPQAQGFVTAFARGGGRLYGIKQHAMDAKFDVIEVTADAVRVLWTDTRYWSDLAVGDTLLQLVRIDGDTIDALQLSREGEVLGEQHAAIADVRAVNTRMVGDAAYYTLRLESSVELGQIEQNTWHVLQTAGSNIAGPSRTANGVTFLALDGQLSTLDGNRLVPRTDTDFVTGLNQLDAHAYACTRTGLRELSSEGLGATVFDLSQLLPPDPCIVPPALRPACELEWQHLQTELLGANIPLVQGSALSQCVADAGTHGIADASTAHEETDGSLGAARKDSGAPALDAGSASDTPLPGSSSSMPSSSRNGGGCSTARSTSPTPLAWLVLFAGLCVRRLRRVASSSAPAHR